MRPLVGIFRPWISPAVREQHFRAQSQKEPVEESWSSECVAGRILWGAWGAELGSRRRGEGDAGSLMGVSGPPSWGGLLPGRQQQGGPWATTKGHLLSRF